MNFFFGHVSSYGFNLSQNEIDSLEDLKGKLSTSDPQFEPEEMFPVFSSLSDTLNYSLDELGHVQFSGSTPHFHSFPSLSDAPAIEQKTAASSANQQAPSYAQMTQQSIQQQQPHQLQAQQGSPSEVNKGQISVQKMFQQQNFNLPRLPSSQQPAHSQPAQLRQRSNTQLNFQSTPHPFQSDATAIEQKTSASSASQQAPSHAQMTQQSIQQQQPHQLQTQQGSPSEVNKGQISVQKMFQQQNFNLPRLPSSQQPAHSQPAQLRQQSNTQLNFQSTPHPFQVGQLRQQTDSLPFAQQIVQQSNFSQEHAPQIQSVEQNPSIPTPGMSELPPPFTPTFPRPNRPLPPPMPPPFTPTLQRPFMPFFSGISPQPPAQPKGVQPMLISTIIAPASKKRFSEEEQKYIEEAENKTPKDSADLDLYNVYRHFVSQFHIINSEKRFKDLNEFCTHLISYWYGLRGELEPMGSKDVIQKSCKVERKEIDKYCIEMCCNEVSTINIFKIIRVLSYSEVFNKILSQEQKKYIHQFVGRGKPKNLYDCFSKKFPNAFKRGKEAEMGKELVEDYFKIVKERKEKQNKMEEKASGMKDESSKIDESSGMEDESSGMEDESSKIDEANGMEDEIGDQKDSSSRGTKTQTTQQQQVQQQQSQQLQTQQQLSQSNSQPRISPAQIEQESRQVPHTQSSNSPPSVSYTLSSSLQIQSSFSQQWKQQQLHQGHHLPMPQMSQMFPVFVHMPIASNVMTPPAHPMPIAPTFDPSQEVSKKSKRKEISSIFKEKFNEEDQKYIEEIEAKTPKDSADLDLYNVYIHFFNKFNIINSKNIFSNLNDFCSHLVNYWYELRNEIQPTNYTKDAPQKSYKVEEREIDKYCFEMCCNEVSTINILKIIRVFSYSDLSKKILSQAEKNFICKRLRDEEFLHTFYQKFKKNFRGSKMSEQQILQYFEIVRERKEKAGKIKDEDSEMKDEIGDQKDSSSRGIKRKDSPLKDDSGSSGKRHKIEAVAKVQ